MPDCKSPTHKAYGDAVEGLYIQTWIASRDLAKLVSDSGLDATTAREQGRFLLNQQEKIADVEQRLAFGRQQLAEANAAVNRHFDRGCSALKGLVEVSA